MAEPTEQDVRDCYQQARAFFKGGAKADNKFYDIVGFPAKAKAAKHRIQSGKQLTADGARDKFSSHTIGYGQVMRETGNTYGNCGEATAVAASFVEQRMQDVELAVASTSPCDHAFLVVGTTPAAGLTVSGLGQIPRQRNVFVIDVWAGICCHASDFPTHLQTKMQNWQTNGKRIATVWTEVHDGKRAAIVEPVSWGRAILASSLTWKDPRSFGTTGDLQQLREHMERERHRAMAPLHAREQEIVERQSKLDQDRQALATDREQFQRDHKIWIERSLAASTDANEQASLLDRQRTLADRPQQYLQEFALELQMLQQKLNRDRKHLDRDLKYLNLQDRHAEGPMPPIARQRVPRPAATDSEALSELNESLKSQLDGNSGGRRASPRR